MSFSNYILAVIKVIVAYGTWKVLSFVKRNLRTHWRYLPGPESPSALWGNMEQTKEDSEAVHEKWSKQYGKTFKYKMFFLLDVVCTFDMRALNHVLTHSVDYQKPSAMRVNLSRLLGDGLLVTEGEKHKQQRRIMNPSFGPSSIRELTPIFFRKAIELRDIWATEVSKSTDNKAKIDVLSWLSRTTLDIIGLGGFNYKFNALNTHGKPNELNRAFNVLFSVDGEFNFLETLQAFFPLFRIIPTERGRQETDAKAAMMSIGEQLLQERKNVLLGEQIAISESVEQDTADLGGRDLLTVLVKANLEEKEVEAGADDVEKGKTDAKWDREGRRAGIGRGMSDEDVVAQVPTFLVAGHETTSTATMWTLFSLSLYPEIQSRLRAELLLCTTPTPSMDTLAALPYLDAVVREALRLHAAVTSTIRIAEKDDEIPLAEPYIDRRGQSCETISVKKGDGIYIPILSINRSTEIWGEDAHEFNPDRWLNLPDTATSIPGVWGHMMTFLGGARSCIGYRFALIEMKALLFTLIRSLEFTPAVPYEDIQKRSSVIMRPYVKSEPDKGSQLPLIVRRIDAEVVA